MRGKSVRFGKSVSGCDQGPGCLFTKSCHTDGYDRSDRVVRAGVIGRTARIIQQKVTVRRQHGTKDGCRARSYNLSAAPVQPAHSQFLTRAWGEAIGIEQRRANMSAGFIRRIARGVNSDGALGSVDRGMRK